MRVWVVFFLSRGARLDFSRSALAARIIAKPTTKTGISVTFIREDTLAGDSARTDVPSVKIRPLIRNTRLNNAAAGVRAGFTTPA